MLVSAAVIWRDGRVLLTRRMKGAHLEGLWEFPGGKVEDGEDPEDALVRECREECGVDVVVDDILDVTFHRYPKKHVLLLFYSCRLGSAAGAGEGDPVRDLGVAEHVWCTPAEVRGYDLPPPDARVVGKIEGRGRAETPEVRAKPRA